MGELTVLFKTPDKNCLLGQVSAIYRQTQPWFCDLFWRLKGGQKQVNCNYQGSRPVLLRMPRQGHDKGQKDTKILCSMKLWTQPLKD